MRKAIVIINEQHKLLPEQKEILNTNYKDNRECLNVSADGWNLEEIKSKVEELKGNIIIFASPIPAMIKFVMLTGIEVRIFHNDNREKVELPNGKIISRVAQEGWQLV